MKSLEEVQVSLKYIFHGRSTYFLVEVHVHIPWLEAHSLFFKQETLSSSKLQANLSCPKMTLAKNLVLHLLLLNSATG